jgi:hypothetical protein
MVAHFELDDYFVLIDVMRLDFDFAVMDFQFDCALAMMVDSDVEKSLAEEIVTKKNRDYFIEHRLKHDNNYINRCW